MPQILKKAPPGMVVTCLVSFFLLATLILMRAFPEQILDTFTCAGKVVLSGADPYRTEPLRTCELQLNGTRFAGSGAVEPAPLPAYGLAPFSLFSTWPRKLEHVIFPMLLLVAVIVTCFALAKLTAFPLPGLMLIFVPATYLNMFFGEITLFALAAIALAALALAHKRYGLAALAASCSMIEPHIGIVCCLGLFLWVAQTRRTFLVCAFVAVVVSLATLNLERNVEYFRQALPGQAIAEVYAADQYSLTRMLFLVGVSPALALKLGALSYAVMSVFGIWLGKKLSDVLEAPEFIALVPPAAILLGGTFVHNIQMCIALPCAIVLAHYANTRFWTSWFAIPLLALSLNHPSWRLTWLVYLSPFLAAWFFASVKSARTIIAAWSAAGLLVLCFLALAAAVHLPSFVSSQIPHELLAGGRIASDAWGAYLRATTPLSPKEWLERIPTWLGLLCLLFAVAQFTKHDAILKERGAIENRPSSVSFR